MMKLLLLSIFLTALFSACSKPRSIFQASPYDPEVARYTTKLTGTKKKARHLQGLETAFQQAQRLNLRLVDSLLEENRPELWPIVNTLHRRLQARQKKVTALQPLRSKDGYEPTLHFVTNMADREAESRRNAATYLYGKARKLLTEAAETGHRPAAREAFHTLQDLKQNYYLYWENANALYDSARVLGVTHILFAQLTAPDSKAPVSRWEVSAEQARRLNDEWHRYYIVFSPARQYDYVVQCRVESMQVGSECRSETTRTEEKDIQTGCEEIKDTSGQVIERKPIYERVKAEVRQLSLSRRADGVLAVEVRNVHNDSLVVSKALAAYYNYSEDFTYVSGDARALTHLVSTSFDSYPSAPSDDRMREHLLGNMQSQLFRLLKKNLAER